MREYNYKKKKLENYVTGRGKQKEKRDQRSLKNQIIGREEKIERAPPMVNATIIALW